MIWHLLSAKKVSEIYFKLKTNNLSKTTIKQREKNPISINNFGVCRDLILQSRCFSFHDDFPIVDHMKYELDTMKREGFKMKRCENTETWTCWRSSDKATFQPPRHFLDFVSIQFSWKSFEKHTFFLSIFTDKTECNTRNIKYYLRDSCRISYFIKI